VTAPAAEAQSDAEPGAQSDAEPQAPAEDRTVASVWAQGDSSEEGGTVPAVASATLVVYAPNRPPFRFPVSGAAVTIGRSTRGNDLVIDTDGQISKRHARIELEPDRHFTLYDLNSTNGTKVNGRRIDNRALKDGDEIAIGETRLTFQQSGEGFGRPPEADRHAPPAAAGRAQGAFGGAAAALVERDAGERRPARLVLVDHGQDIDDFLLASETLVGRGVTNDVVLPDRSIATRHARIVRDGAGYAVESLAEAAITTVNGIRVGLEPVPIASGDRIGMGDLGFRFEG